MTPPFHPGSCNSMEGAGQIFRSPHFVRRFARRYFAAEISSVLSIVMGQIKRTRLIELSANACSKPRTLLLEWADRRVHCNFRIVAATLVWRASYSW